MRMYEEKLTSGYFHWIYCQLLRINEEGPWAGLVLEQLRLLKMDVRFLKTFCLGLESWDYTIDDDEESMKIWRSMITTLTVIWPKEHKGLSLLNRLAETSPFDMSIQDFHSVVVELEAKIQLSKQKLQGWCENLMHFSMQCRYSDISDFLKHLQKILILFSSYRAAKIVPLKKQVDILRAKIAFLDESLNNVKRCPDGKETLQFLNFICVFANSAAFLTCLYWAKEDNEEIATEMNIVLFDMLQRFIPYAYDITPLYIGILISYNLQSSDSFVRREAVESFVDFFFKHMAAILKGDFQILRDQLIFLFTFLTDPPCENAEEEGSTRSQIHAFFCEDAYLLLPFDVMKKDFFDEKMLLSDCMMRIDKANAKIRQLYFGFSDSWIILEVEKMEHIYFEVHKVLSWIEKHAQWADLVLGQLELYRVELRFLRLFLLCFVTLDDSDEEIRGRLNSMITSLQGIWRKKEDKEARCLHAIRTGITDWYPWASELEGKIQLSKLEIEVWWKKLFHQPFRGKPSTYYMILKFLVSIIDNLNDLVSYKAGELAPFKKQIETLEDKVLFMKIFLKLTANGIGNRELGEFKTFVQIFAYDAACLTFLYWATEANDEIAYDTNSMLSHMLQKIKPTTPDIARLYFGTLEAIYMQRSDSLMFGQVVFYYVDLFLEDPVIPFKDDFRILQDNMVFLLTFLNDPPNKNAEELICSQIDVQFWEGVYGLLPFDDMKGDFSGKKVLLSNFIMKIETINASISLKYYKSLDSSLYNFPKVISPQFLDCLIQNLRNLMDKMISDRKYAPFAKYKIIKIEEELVSLCPFFYHIFKLKSELKETWLEVVNFLHLTEHIVTSCISSWFVYDHPIWYHMSNLSDVFNGIKIVKAKLEKIKENTTINARCLPFSAGFISPLSEQARPSEINEIVVGFEDEVEEIIAKLTREHMSLDIVFVVGMGGLGKTTLAKQVYSSSLVKCKFDVFAFCSISQEHNTRRLLLDILCHIKGGDDKLSDMTDDDLAHQLWKCLSRQKYLIVLDDIWNVNVWNGVKSSFPDDKNGSRVMFTTRSNGVANKCKISCSPHQLRFMSEVESWELLQKKVFHNSISPPYLHEIGKLIAKNCKGLPLAVVVIAGLLARTEKSLRWWKEVAERVFSYLSEEGCMKILELSYMHLPENLKPCLLYLGAFPKDTLIRVKKVILLWIAEGFIQDSKTKCLEDVAKGYLHDLVDRSLIIIGAIGSNGEIKTFCVHSLIHDLCQAKCRDGNFFLLNHGIASSSFSDPSINDHYRVSTKKQWDVTIAAGSSLPNPRSLLYFCEQDKTRDSNLPLRKFRLAQVLDLDLMWREYDIEQLNSLVHLRHVHARLMELKSVPPSICNLWNIGSLTLTVLIDCIQLPEAFWRMKSLRHVKVDKCILKFSDVHEHEAYPVLDKVVSFSRPVLSSGKDVQRLLQRLPVVQKLGCYLKKPLTYDEESYVETLNFHGKLESLKLSKSLTRTPHLINFPSTLKRLTLVWFQLPWTAISAIAELHCLQVLKLRWVSFPEPRLDIEDMIFQNLKYFELHDEYLVEWNASTESFPCLEQLVIECPKLEGLPSCFEEISTLKRVVVKYCPEVIESSAFSIREEQMELGNKVEVLIYSR